MAKKQMTIVAIQGVFLLFSITENTLFTSLFRAIPKSIRLEAMTEMRIVLAVANSAILAKTLAALGDFKRKASDSGAVL